MSKEEAYRIVFSDLCENGIFRGLYDARNGKPSFMYGVSVVMECIAYGVSEDVGDEFAETFIENMLLSEDKVEDE